MKPLQQIFTVAASIQDKLEKLPVPTDKTAWDVLKDWLYDQTPDEYSKIVSTAITQIEGGTAANFKNLLDSVWDELEEKLSESVPEKLQPLLKTLEEATKTESGEALISWPLDKSQDLNLPHLDAATFKLELDAEAKLSCQNKADADIPGHSAGIFDESSDQVDTNKLNKIITTTSLNTKLAAAAGTTLPFNYGSLGIEAGANARLELNFYQLHDAKKRWVKAVADDLTGLPDPFSAKSIQQALESKENSGEFHGFECRIEKGFSLDGKVQVAAPARLLTGNLASLGVSMGYQMQVSRPIDLVVYSQEISGESWLKIAYEDKSSKASNFSADLGLELNFQDKATAAAKVLSDQLEEVEELINLLQGEALVNKNVVTPVFSALTKLDNSQDWVNIVNTVQGDMTPAQLQASWQTKLDDTITETGQSAQQVIMELVNEKLTAAISNSGITDSQLKSYLTSLIPTASEKFATELLKQANKQLVPVLTSITAGGSANKLATALSNAGITFNGTAANLANQINTITAPVKQRLENYQSLLKNLKKYIDVAAKANIQVGLNYHRKRSDSTEQLVSLAIKASALTKNKNIKAIDQLLSGKIESAIKIAKSNSAEVELEEAQITQLIQSEKGTGVSAVLVDFSVGKESLLNQKVEYLQNLATGEITVGLEGTLKDRAFAISNSRQALISSAISLSTKNLPATSLAISWVSNQTKLTRSELDHTLKALRRFELLDNNGRLEALRIADNNVFKGKQSSANCRLDFAVSFSNQQIEKIFSNLKETHNGIAEPLEILSRDVLEFGFVTEEQVEHLKKESLVYKKYAKEADELVSNYFLKGYKSKNRPKKYNLYGNKPGTAKQVKTSKIMNAVYDICKKYQQLKTAFSTMEEIKTSQITETITWYEEEQKKLIESLKGWIKVENDSFFDLFNIQWKSLGYDAVNPFLLLFIAILMDLAETDEGGVGFVFNLSVEESDKTALYPLV